MAVEITDEGATEEDMKRWVAWFAQAYASSWTEDQHLAYGEMVTIVAPIPIPERHRDLSNPDKHYPAAGIKGTLYGVVTGGQEDWLEPGEWGDIQSGFITRVCDGYTGLNILREMVDDRLIEQRSYPCLR
jgi:hypothetical protein